MADDDIQLSIVIAAWNSDALLRQCLMSLKGQTAKIASEVIVISNFSVSPVEFGSRIKFLELPETATVPELRSRGIGLSRGKIVALLEDHCILDSKWCQEIRKAHESADVAIGGPVENASMDHALDWAVYLYDYGKYMLPSEQGAVGALSGLNVSYKRAAMDEISDIYQDGFFETIVNDELKRRGYFLRLWPQAIVYHNKSYELKRAAEHSFHLARSYAARRVFKVSRLTHMLFALFSLLLPVLLPARIVSTTFKKGRNIAPLLRSFPFIVLLMFIWSYGEFCGYLFGEGKSGGQWR